MSSRSTAVRRRLVLIELLLAGATLVASGVQAPPASAGRVANAASQSVPVPLSGSVSTPESTSAVVVMGKGDGQHDLFWQLFGFDTATSHWSLITPPGVADNGGLIAAQGESKTLLVGFGASQGLAFSPLALSDDGGTAWSPGGLAEPLATAPSAIALGTNSTAVALVDGGGEEVLTRVGSLTNWSILTTEPNLSGLALAKKCGIQSLGAVGIEPSGEVLVGASCRRSGVVGVFVKSRSGWSLSNAPVAKGMRADTFSTLRITATGDSTSALFSGVEAGTRNLFAGWVSQSGDDWTLSGPLPLGARDQIVASGVGAGGSQFVLLRSGSSTRAEVISGPGSAWRSLSPLPPGTATIATEPAGQIVALSVKDTRLTVWKQDSNGSGWKANQSMTVPIVFGSSG
jgi:hypothetical protein